MKAQDLRRISVMRCLALDGATAEIVARSNAIGIASVLLKGRAIADRLYDTGDLRTYADVDLIIHPDGFPAAEAVLEEAGFVFALASARNEERSQHAHSWSRGNIIHIDLHKTIQGAAASPSAVWRALSANTEVLTIGGVAVRVLGLPAQGLVIALHAAQHIGIDHSDEVRAHVAKDLRRAIASLPEATWAETVPLAREIDAVGWLASGLRLAPEGVALASRLGLDAPVPRDLRIRRTSVTGVSRIERVARIPGVSSKLRALGRQIVPSRSFIVYRWPFARRGGLALWAAYVWYILRAFVLIPRALVSWLMVK